MFHHVFVQVQSCVCIATTTELNTNETASKEIVLIAPFDIIPPWKKAK